MAQGQGETLSLDSSPRDLPATGVQDTPDPGSSQTPLHFRAIEPRNPIPLGGFPDRVAGGERMEEWERWTKRLA